MCLTQAQDFDVQGTKLTANGKTHTAKYTLEQITMLLQLVRGVRTDTPKLQPNTFADDVMSQCQKVGHPWAKRLEHKVPWECRKEGI